MGSFAPLTYPFPNWRDRNQPMVHRVHVHIQVKNNVWFCYLTLECAGMILDKFDLFVYLNIVPCNATCDSIVSSPRSAASVRSTEEKRHNAVTGT